MKVVLCVRALYQFMRKSNTRQCTGTKLRSKVVNAKMGGTHVLSSFDVWKS